MDIRYSEKIRRCLMIQGAYFQPHVMERAEERLGLSDFNHNRFQEKIVNLDGDLYYDRKHENYQLVLEDLAFAFDLTLHKNRRGLMASVKTTVTSNNDFRDNDDRYQRLHPDDYELCENCELVLKQIVDNHAIQTGTGENQ